MGPNFLTQNLKIVKSKKKAREGGMGVGGTIYVYSLSGILRETRSAAKILRLGNMDK